MTVIKVPATSANLGPGFDSIGIAIAVYLELEILEPAKEWFIEHELEDEIPHDETNMIIQTALQVAPNLNPHRLKMKSDIPPARGLGSSSAAIVAGIELANQLAGLELSADEKIQIGARIEGHPDNIMPAVVGDCTVGTIVDERVYWKKIPFPSVSMVVTVPHRALLTSESRAVLPKTFSLGNAVQGSSVANVFVSAVYEKDIPLMGKMMEQDVFHEPYRSSLIPELEKVRALTKEFGAYGSYLSGAGTTIMTITSGENNQEIIQKLQSHVTDCDVFASKIERVGLQVE